MILDFNEFFLKSGSFGAILCRLDMVLDGGDAAHGIENLGDRIVLAFAGVFELVGKIVLVLCIALQSGNAALKILNVGLTRGGSYDDRLLVLKGRNMLNVVFPARAAGCDESKMESSCGKRKASLVLGPG